MADSNLIAGLTGLSNAIGGYLGQKNQMNLQEQQAQRNAEREQAGKLQAMEYQANIDLSKSTAMYAFKLALEGKVDPEVAKQAHPKAARLVEKFVTTNNRPPTVAEFSTLVKTLEADDNKPGKLTGAQGAVDREFAKEYAKYVTGGGYADAINQIQTLEGVLVDLEEGKQNLTGPVVGSGEGTIMGLPRKILAQKSVAAQQSVEQSVQRTLKQTLGGQFTEREGQLFMQRGYDPQLSEAENAKKLRSMIGKLKSMALAKQKAVDFYEENGTLNGFKGTFYTLKDGVVTEATKQDFYSMIGEQPVDKRANPDLEAKKAELRKKLGL